MNVRQVAVNKLKPYENNPRKIGKDAIEKVAASIKKFGFQQPIVVDADMVIIVGHTRLLAAKQLGLDKVPVVVASNLTEAQANAYRLADNKSGEFSKWDEEKLEQELMELENLDFDMESFGFDIDREMPDLEEDDYQEDDTEEIYVKQGDIYQLGVHRLMCGDSTKREDVERLTGGAIADLVFTDPPYGYEYQSNYQDKFDVLKNDDKILDYISAIYDFMKEDSAIYSFCGYQSLRKWLNYFDSTKLKLKNVICWVKNNWSMGDLTGAYAGQYEVAIYLVKGNKKLNGRRDTDVWKFDREPPTLHPTMKPIELIGFALNKSSRDGDMVLDPFGGSGSTLVACEKMNRKCCMMELDPHYCQVIINRWEQLTGKKAEKIAV